MIYQSNCAALSIALEKLKEIVKNNEHDKVKTIIFCEDRLSLAAERTVCAELGGTFLTSVFTLARFLASKIGKDSNVLSSQGSAMAVRRIIEENRQSLTLFKKLSASGAAQAVYDTIALLYSSRVSPEDTAEAAKRGGVLGGKLHDLAIIYEGYERFLKESGKQDRNGYLRRLPEVISTDPEIKGSRIIFLGFQAFTCTVQECVRAAFGAAESVYGLFIGGSEDIYVNEAGAFFTAAAREFGGVKSESIKGNLFPEAEILRKGLFNPDSFYKEPFPTAYVGVYESADVEEEYEFIAASIKKHVEGGTRYAKISVMLPDIDNSERALARVFSRYKIPYYADRQIALSGHPLCEFTLNYIICAATGCRFKEVDAVVSSPYFPAERREKDIFRNYLLKLGGYRGSVKKTPNPDTLKTLGFDFESVEKVRKLFLDGLAKIDIKGGNSGICGGLLSIFDLFNVKEKLESIAKEYRDARPAAAEFSRRALDAVVSVLTEASAIAAENSGVNEYVKIVKSGFAAMKISLIPPKADAVFVGDLAKTANTGSDVVFAANLTGDVPSASSDTSLLTDREIAALEGVNLNISPKIRQVNARKREMCALNLCAFRKRLYLTFSIGGDDADGASEIISYARALFCTTGGAQLAPVSTARFAENVRAVPYYCSEKLPAVRHLRKYSTSTSASSIYEVLKNSGYEDEARQVLERRFKRDISCGQRLYLGNSGSLSPTTLESYFSCPYESFITKGLKVKEREAGVMRAADTGNFIHAVLQDAAKEMNAIPDIPSLDRRVREIAEDKLKKPPYSSLADSSSGSYVEGELIEEAVKISRGTYEQLKNSSFSFKDAEQWGEINLSDGVRVCGRIDRVDESGDMVRVIDYKTGFFDSASTKYYLGSKLQLPLYLLSASKGKRAAGAYYFPAAVTYKEKVDGVFRLQGFMDGSDDVVLASDSTVQPKGKSNYVNANYQGRMLENTMSREDFAYFLEYSRLVADGAVREMTGGNITPSPAEGCCEFCKAGGCCGISLGKDTEERTSTTVKCTQIAEIVRKNEKGEDTDDASHF